MQVFHTASVMGFIPMTEFPYLKADILVVLCDYSILSTYHLPVPGSVGPSIKGRQSFFAEESQLGPVRVPSLV